MASKGRMNESRGSYHRSVITTAGNNISRLFCGIEREGGKQPRGGSVDYLRGLASQALVTDTVPGLAYLVENQVPVIASNHLAAGTSVDQWHSE